MALERLMADRMADLMTLRSRCNLCRSIGRHGLFQFYRNSAQSCRCLLFETNCKYEVLLHDF